MNMAHFNMRLRPFRASPDSRFYYPSAPHEAVLNQILRALDNDEGFVLLTGAPGTGKTLIAHVLLERLGIDVCSALITNCRFSCRRDLLQTILFDLGLPYQDRTEQELRLALTEHILDNHAAGRRTILIMDEAQDLSLDLLEELRLLSNLETGHGKAVQVILIAQPALLLELRKPELEVLRHRLNVRLHLDALDMHEADDFLRHQLKVAGAEPEAVFSEEALGLLARHTSGVPRVLNQAAATALSLAEMQQAENVDAEAAIEALTRFGIQVELDGPPDEIALAREVPHESPKGEDPKPEFPAAPVSVSSGFPTPGNFALPREIASAYIYQPGEPVKMIFGENG
ncbi:MAG TPA: AAA family ATPase [Gemmataceae bacterium]|nr:AAA family ATPase [Gemmataceae bacterium]